MESDRIWTYLSLVLGEYQKPWVLGQEAILLSRNDSVKDPYATWSAFREAESSRCKDVRVNLSSHLVRRLRRDMDCQPTNFLTPYVHQRFNSWTGFIFCPAGSRRWPLPSMELETNLSLAIRYFFADRPDISGGLMFLKAFTNIRDRLTSTPSPEIPIGTYSL